VTETVGLDYRESCLEWLKGCSNTIDGHPEDCKECTKAFREHIEHLVGLDNIIVPERDKIESLPSVNMRFNIFDERGK
jgi:hypothetical protein